MTEHCLVERIFFPFLTKHCLVIKGKSLVNKFAKLEDVLDISKFETKNQSPIERVTCKRIKNYCNVMLKRNI